MTLQTWRPFAELRRNDGFNNGLGFPFTGFRPQAIAPTGAQSNTWQIPLDVVEQADKLLITASVPWISPADIKVSIDDDVLTIRAETPGVEGQGYDPEEQAEHAESK